MENNLDKVVVEIEKILSGQKLGLDNILSVCISAMKIVEGIPKLKGAEKKELVLKSIEIVMNRTDGDITLLTILSSFIDNAISIDRGQLKFNVKPKTIWNCCLGICKGGEKK
jgi:hypothetical protein